jgi:hypothetical protein
VSVLGRTKGNSPLLIPKSFSWIPWRRCGERLRALPRPPMRANGQGIPPGAAWPLNAHERASLTQGGASGLGEGHGAVTAKFLAAAEVANATVAVQRIKARRSRRHAAAKLAPLRQPGDVGGDAPGLVARWIAWRPTRRPCWRSRMPTAMASCPACASAKLRWRLEMAEPLTQRDSRHTERRCNQQTSRLPQSQSSCRPPPLPRRRRRS